MTNEKPNWGYMNNETTEQAEHAERAYGDAVREVGKAAAWIALVFGFSWWIERAPFDGYHDHER